MSDTSPAEDQSERDPSKAGIDPAPAGDGRAESGLRRLQQLSRPVPLSVLSMLFALAVGIVSWLGVAFTLDTRTALFSGANIEHAFAVVLVGGLLGVVVIGFLRRRRRLLASLLFAEAAILAAAIVLVALDGATYRARYSCDFMCSGATSYTETHHVGGLYVLFGLPLVVLLVQAARALRDDRPPESPKSKYEQPGWS